MKLTELLKDLAITNIDSDLSISGLTLNSNAVSEGNIFIALHGSKQHGLTYTQQAIERGAAAILFDGNDIELAKKHITNPNVLPIAITNLAENLGEMAARFYQHPSQQMAVIGITGTNGKTSCSQFLSQVLENCGVIGTLGWGRYEQLKETFNTTPDAITIQKILAELKNDNCNTVAMEVSSHGLAQGRINGMCFKGAVFTNFSRDHLDYHSTMDAYLETKLKLFNAPLLEFAVINLDDMVSERIVAAIPKNVSIIGITKTERQSPRGQTLVAQNIILDLGGITFEVSWQNQLQTLHVPLIGLFNLENVLCVLTVMLALGVKLEDAAQRLSHLKPINGRMERFGGENNQPLVIVDYAHTPDALEKVLCSLRQHTHGKLGVVFGCGGNRDSGKRTQMGRVAEEFADWMIITDDNPRFEANETIVEDILNGCFNKEAKVIHDRAKAIRRAIEHADFQDCILIAGKGHEDYQEIEGVKHPFNDAQCVREIMAQS